MKECIVYIPFFTNSENEEYLNDGYRISNREQISNLLIESKNKLDNLYVYMPREETNLESAPTHNSQWPDSGDIIVGEVVGIKEDGLDINITNSLYYSKLNDPKIRINGYMIKNNKEIILTKITRFTMTSYNYPHDLDLNI